ncbi:MAG: AraC family transcriptional regulator [Prevotella sp.]|jgi:AraC-like DNA-binding protein|nr:AraC family transcriptional regulator [Prevotella sp.]
MKNTSHIKYLIASDQDILWGLTVSSVGFQHIKKNSPYPPGNHPTRYLFSTERGRILDEYQLIYIVRGRGSFISKSQKLTNIKEGNMFLLFPGEWHSYKPDSLTGWDEYWIGFKGINIDNRIENGFFRKDKPVFNIGIRDDIIQLFNQAINISREQNTGFQQMLAGIVNYLLGFAYSQNKHASFEDLRVVKQINRAKIIMYESFSNNITPEEIASQVNMGYSWFRKLFKQYTGFPPSQFLIELKVQKCKELLTNTDLSSQEIAYEVGFENPDYFCTLFKKKVGLTPIKYREITQGKEI